MPTKHQQFQVEILNWLKQITEAIIICIIQQFEGVQPQIPEIRKNPQNCHLWKTHCPGIVAESSFREHYVQQKVQVGTDYADQPAHHTF